MKPSSLQLRRLAERAMRGGQLPLALLLEVLVPVAKLRALAKDFGLQPKGGFRLEKAPAKVVAELLAEQQEAADVDRVVGLLFDEKAAAGKSDKSDKRATADKTADKEKSQSKLPSKEKAVSPILQLKEQELAQVRAELERSRIGLGRAQERETDLRREKDHLTGQVQRLRSDLALAERPGGSVAPVPGDDVSREAALRIRDLQQELAGYVEADEGLRRQLAIARTRIRQLEAELEEVLPLVPKGRRKKRPPPEPAAPERRVVVPYFEASFYRSLEGKDRKSVERAIHAVLLFCTEGHAYPGLEVKQMGGQDTWSLRASLGLRVYFRQRADGDAVFLELADREEQRTTLRRLKER